MVVCRAESSSARCFHDQHVTCNGIEQRRPGQLSRLSIVFQEVLPAGAWPEFTGEDEITGVCANVLTTTEPTLPSESSRTHSIGVEVEPASL